MSIGSGDDGCDFSVQDDDSVVLLGQERSTGKKIREALLDYSLKNVVYANKSLFINSANILLNCAWC